MRQTRAVETFAGRAVKQNGISLGFPNSRDFYRPGAVETKENAARLTTTHQNAFGHPERIGFKLIVLT